MTTYALLGALEVGLLFGIVALAVHLSFRVLEFPDMTVDGSLPLGAAVTALLMVWGVHPALATLGGMLGGAAAGAVTGFLTARLGVLNLLSGILVMIALYSVNLRVMGQPNIALIGMPTIFSPVEALGVPGPLAVVIVLAAITLAVAGLVARFLLSEIGLGLRATGTNSRMAAANGVNTRAGVILGLTVSNGLVGLAGGLFAQSQGAADVAMGIGTILVGLAAVIIGETIMPGARVITRVAAAIAGSIVYRLAVALALNSDWFGLKAQDLNLITALLVVAALLAPKLRHRLRKRGAVLPGQRP